MPSGSSTPCAQPQRRLVALATRIHESSGLVDAAGAFCALGYVALAVLAREAGEPNLGAFYGIVAWTAMPVFLLYLRVVRQDEPIPVARLLLWAVVFRLCGLAGGPFFEDDFYRYLWDGYRFATAGTPYGVAPEAFFLDMSVPPALRSVLDQINNPDLPTIYGPTTELLFLFGHWLQAGNVAVLQALLIAVDVATIALLLRLAPARNVLLYAWCPLVVKEVAFTAHPDGLGVCLLLAAVVLAGRRRAGWAAACLGLAVGAKVFALLLVPLVLIRARLRHWCIFAATLALLYGPFLVAGATDLDTLVVFAREWEFNSAAFGLLAAVLPPNLAKLSLAVAFGVFWLWYYRRHRSAGGEVPRGDWVYGVFLLAAPVINAWYLLWLLPFAVVYPSRWAWAASVAVLLSYITGLHLGNYEMQAYAQPWWVRPVEFGVIFVALLFDGRRRHRAGQVAGAAND